MKTDEQVRKALQVLEALSAAKGQRMDVQAVCASLDLDEVELDSCLNLISNLADRETGARAVVDRSDNEVVLHGDAGRLQTLRLDIPEGMALAAALRDLHIGKEAADRLRRGLLPLDWTPDEGSSQLAGGVAFGPWFPVLREALEDGVRCSLTYRTQGEREARARIVDPAAIETRADAAYLLAWDVEKDAERRYRLDRIADVQLTEDSAERHLYRGESTADSLARTGERIVLAMDAGTAAGIDWDGALPPEPDAHNPEEVRVTVYVGSRPWLFDQVLASGGHMRVVEPQEAADAFLIYARSLLQ